MTHQKRILTIDDHPLNQRLFSRLLSTQGYEIIMAFDGFSGIELARKHKPDLILLDILLPDISGLDVLRLIKLDSRLQSIPIIAVTAYELDQNREICMKAGFSEYMTKPVMRRELYEKVQACLGTAQRD